MKVSGKWFDEVTVGDEFSGRMLHLPCGWWVSDEDRERIVATLRSGW